MTLPPDTQWFDRLGACIGCGKPATGIIRDHHNDNRGPACARCAEKAIEQARRKQVSAELSRMMTGDAK
jgi:ferredoxin